MGWFCSVAKLRQTECRMAVMMGFGEALCSMAMDFKFCKMKIFQRQPEFSCIANGNAKWCSYFGREFSGFFLTKHTLSAQSNSHALWYLPKGNVGLHKNLHMGVCSRFTPN